MNPNVTDLIGAELASRHRLDSIDPGCRWDGCDFFRLRSIAFEESRAEDPHVGSAIQDDLVLLLVQEAKLLAQRSNRHFFPNIYDIILPADDSPPIMVMELLLARVAGRSNAAAA